MSLRIKKILGAAVLATGLIGFTMSAAQARSLEEIKETGELVVANSGAYPPFSFVDTSGNLVGFDVDIAHAIAEKLGVKAKVESSPWGGIIAALLGGKFDTCICSMSITPERQRAVDYTQPYWRVRISVWVKEDSPTHSLEDLKGKKVGSTLGEVANSWAMKNGKWDNQTFQGLPDLLMALTSGRVDAVITDDVPVYAAIKASNYPIRKVDVEGLPVFENAFALPKNQPELKAALQQALEAILADGTYKKISHKWLGQDIR